MAEEIKGEEQEEITIPVTVTPKSMKDVTKKQPYSNVSVLFLNKKGQAHMVPKDLALAHVKKGVGYIVEKKNKDYMKLYKMAVGYDENIKTDKFLQAAGKVVSIEDSTRLDLKQLIEKEAAEVKKATGPAAPKAPTKGTEAK